MSDQPPPDKTRDRRGRRLLRHARNFLITCVLLLGPNFVFFGKWYWPDQALPEVPVKQDVQQAAPGLPPQLAKSLAQALRDSRERAGLPSLSAAIAWNGQLQWAGATGLADIERGMAASLRSRYRTGSVAKPITAVAMMRLVDAGKLSLDAPLSTYVEGLPAHLQPLTAKLLASHRAGVRHYSRVPAWWMGWHENYSTRQYDTVAAGLPMFVEDALRFEPGTGFQYTTFGYTLLSRQLEGAAGQSFPSLLRTLVFQPFGMVDTAVDTAAPMPGRVAFYQGKDGLYTPSYPINSSYKIAGGGLVSTPSDLVRLGLALLGDDLVSTAAKRALWTPLALADGSMNSENYALGWRVDDSVRLLGKSRPVPILHHGGTQPGAAAFFVLLPEHGIVVAVMSNSGTSSARAEVQESAYALARLALARQL